MYILHVDMDAFFAAIEQRDHPHLRGKPVIVGGSDPTRRGVVSTASYEARKYGVRSAMPLSQAYRLCPRGVFLDGNHSKYSMESRKIREIFYSFTPRVEMISIDEAFLDVKGCELLHGTPLQIAKKIKETIKKERGLTASVGIAPNKFLAKLASDLDKPDGLTIIRKEDIPEKVWPLPIGKLWGVGEKTEEKLKERGIKTIGTLAELDPETVQANWGRAGLQLYHLARGIDDRSVSENSEVKSIGHEITFPFDVKSVKTLEARLLNLAEKVARRLREDGFRARTIQLKVRYADFKTITRRRTIKSPTMLTREIYQHALELLRETGKFRRGIRLIGVSVSNLTAGDFSQLSLFNPRDVREEELEKVVDAIKDRFGEDILTRARALEEEE